VICTYNRYNGTIAATVSTILSAALVAGSVYFIANASTVPSATYNMTNASPMYCLMTLAPGTGTTSTLQWYRIELNIAAAGPGNISIRRISRR